MPSELRTLYCGSRRGATVVQPDGVKRTEIIIETQRLTVIQRRARSSETLLVAAPGVIETTNQRDAELPKIARTKIQMILLEPTVMTGLDKALFEILVIFSLVISIGLVVTIGSILGVIRAVRRGGQGRGSVSAVCLAAFATAIAAAWPLYWLAHDIRDRSNPINPLLAINVGLCVLPLMWLAAAIHANRAQQR